MDAIPNATANAVVTTIEQTAAAMLPEIATAVGAANPTVARAMALALQLLQSVTQLSNAGAMSPDQLAQLFSSIGKDIQATHEQWVAMNGAVK
jgi:hypothetical protein